VAGYGNRDEIKTVRFSSKIFIVGNQKIVARPGGVGLMAPRVDRPPSSEYYPEDSLGEKRKMGIMKNWKIGIMKSPIDYFCLSSSFYAQYSNIPLT